MGIWKRQWEEIMERSLCAGLAKLKISETGEVFDVDPADLDWDSERIGAELHHYATINFESDGGDYQVEATWNILEYPAGVIYYTNTEVKGGEILQDFDAYQLPPEEYIDEDQLDAILSNTEFYRTFSDEISSLQVLNSLIITDFNAQRTLKRQIFISAVTCLETYLSDAFINTVLSSDKNLRAFFSAFKDFKDKKFPVNELFSYFDKAKETAKKEMLDVVYHNLPKVSNMYKSTFDIAFPDFSDIQNYIITRHDLVHRNGKTKERQEISINEPIVNEVICRIKIFVNALDRELKDKERSEEMKRLNVDLEGF